MKPRFVSLIAVLLSALALIPGISASSGMPEVADTGFVASPASFGWSAGLVANAGGGDFAPYFLASNRHGVISQARGLLATASVSHPLDLRPRFSFGYGLSFWGGATSSVGYERYDVSSAGFVIHQERPSSVWIQNLYAEIKYRSLSLCIGQKERQPLLLNMRLSSGDFIESGNARPIPQARIGFVDFRDIPLTGGWIQIRGDVAYGFLNDNGWWRDHYNYYNQHIASSALYLYRSIYFRTNPRQPLSVIVGAHSAAQFGGSNRTYYKGEVISISRRHSSLKDYLKIFFPFGQNDENYYLGNTIGAWDFQARYRLSGPWEIKAYFQWPWEDGSGIGKLNGFDGIWGIEIARKEPGLLRGLVAEYLDFTNQSGPIHWAPDDYPGTTIHSPATGGDDYYNNKTYNSYAYFGMNIGTPVIMSPIYNTDGYLLCRANRLRGFHLGFEGDFSRSFSYRVLFSYRKAYGDGYYYFRSPIHQTSFMAEATWRIPGVSGLTVDCAVGLDRGKLPDNAFGALVGFVYRGHGSFSRKRSSSFLSL